MMIARKVANPHLIGLFSMLPVIFACAGCWQSQELPIRPGRVIAKGDVLLNNAPLDTGRVTFVPEDAQSPRDEEKWYLAPIANGQFEIEIPPGRYVVRIQKYEFLRDGRAIPQLPEKYDTKSSFTAEIPERDPERLSFQLESKKG